MGQASPVVSIVPCASYEQDTVAKALDACLTALGGMSCFVQTGAPAVLKPNFLWPSPIERAVCTHPELIRAAARQTRAAGATEVVVTDSSGIGSATRCARRLGLVSDELLELVDAEDPRDVAYPGAAFHKLSLSARMVDAPALINLAKAKTHGHMVFTGAVKNTFGAVVGLEKIQWHMRSGRDQHSFAELLVHVHEIVRPRLSIVDAVIAMEGNGPGSGTPRPMGLLLASPNAYAVDAVLCHAWGLSPQHVPTWQVALERGLVPRLDQIELIGPPLDALVQHPAWQMARPAHLRQVGGGHLAFLAPALERLLRILPRVNFAACTSCGRCAQVCGADAIELKNEGPAGKVVPLIDTRRCVSCFCCQEMCPEGAIRVRAGALARLLGLSR